MIACGLLRVAILRFKYGGSRCKVINTRFGLLRTVNTGHHIHRLISVLLLALLLAPALLLTSPALAHELSDSTCAADVVFLWDQKHFAGY